jgi:hypothetical protein
MAGVRKDRPFAVLCVKFFKCGHVLAGLGGLAEMGFLMLPEVVHLEVAVGFEPAFVGLDGQGADQAQARI